MVLQKLYLLRVKNIRLRKTPAITELDNILQGKNDALLGKIMNLYSAQTDTWQ